MISASKNLLHLSLNTYPSLHENFATKRIWNTLSKFFRKHYILGRSMKYRFESYEEDNIKLYLLPKFNSASFGISAHALYYLILKHKIDILLSQDPIVGGFAGVNASKLFKIPIMVEIHADTYFKFFTSRNPYEKILGQIALYSLKNATLVRIVSETFRPELHKVGIPDENIVLIPYRVNLALFDYQREAVDVSKLGIDEDAFVITSIGRFVEQKGYEYLIRGFPQVLNEYPNSYLLIVGRGTLESEYKNLIRDLNMEGRIKLINWVPQELLQQILKKSDVYIQPSVPFRGDAMPRTILEAMAMKAPVIVSRVAGIPGIINHGENGILIEPMSESAIAESIVDLLSNEAERKRLGQNAYLDVKNKYEWNKVFKLWAETLLSMTYQ